jgi:antitoxin PrlF
MALTSTISSKGQVTVPLEIRQRLGLQAGDQIEFVVDQGRTILRPARPAENPFLQFVGALPVFSTRQEVNEWVANLRDEEDRDEDQHNP